MNRPIRISTPAGTGATYVPIDRTCPNITVQAVVTGTVTFTVDYTGDNIIRAAANPYDQSEDLVAAASAAWTNLIASGSSNTSYNGALNATALRVNITAGTGSVRLIITQNK
jgi:hypothetical protein